MIPALIVTEDHTSGPCGGKGRKSHKNSIGKMNTHSIHRITRTYLRGISTRAMKCAMRDTRVFRLVILAYAVASLIHFAHNALYLRAYPHMPLWLTATGVWAAWLTLTSIGTLGYYVYRFRSQTAGALIIAVYALLGFAGLDHYVVAPVAAHSIAMHLTIIVEAATAAVLLAYLASVSHSSTPRPQHR
jgi:hypothetical protein